MSAVRVAIAVICWCSLASPASGQTDWPMVDKAMGRPGSIQPGEVHRYAFPRADLRVAVVDVSIKPALALGSWVAFKPIGGGKAIAMGDLVLLEGEVQPVITALKGSGVEPTALHNHLQGESPRVMYLHIEAQGEPVKIAEAVHSALAITRTPLVAPAAQPGGERLGLDTARIGAALGRAGKVNGGVYQVSIPRAEPVRMAGVELPPAMGVATAINFQPTGQGKAAITGDFVLTADEVSPVIKTLRDGGIVVTALHSHMLDEEPRLLFMHFWAVDDPLKLARALRAALDHMRVQRAGS